MITVNPYLLFNGNCLQAFEFYKTVFRKEWVSISHYSDVPPMDNALPIPDDKKNWVMHVALALDNNNLIMGSDKHPSFDDLNFGDNVKLSLSVDSKEEADRLFNALSASGSIEMPIEDTFWGDYFGMLTDKFGVQWMIAFTKEKSQHN